MIRGARADSLAAGCAVTPPMALGRWLMTLLVALSLTLSATPQFHHHDMPSQTSPAVMLETAPQDLEREGTMLHALFGHNGAGHGGAHGEALPELADFTIATDASRQKWPFAQGQRLTSQDATTPLRPPRA